MFGGIPEDICTQSAKIQDLRLFLNQFEGDFPSAITHCHSLKMLSLAGNKFTGNIPTVFWNLSAMEKITLERNEITGTIPPSIANFTNLEVFSISSNNFHGTVPSEIGQLSSLKLLNLGWNYLEGQVPASIFNFSRLQTLGLTNNSLSGSLPFSIDKGIPNIELMAMSYNQLHGEIPSSISNLSKLTLLELSNNLFSGHIPITLGNLGRLQYLSLSENQFTNNVSMPEQDFLSSLAACNYLEFIQVQSNPITGVLPKSFGSGNLSVSLQKIIFDSCKFRGPLPDEIGNFSNLLWLNLERNELTGAIPTTLGNLRNLQKLDMYGNKLMGSIPYAICNLENLYSVNMAENSLFVPLPSCLGNLSSLKEIKLGGNALNFTIQSALLLFNERMQMINFSNNILHGSLPGDIGVLKNLIELDLSGNELSGNIPSSTSQLQNLITLLLSNNKLDGPIIDSLSNLKDLQYLDLSHNHLSGPIPTSLEKLVNLKVFNVSFNELDGEIPDGGPFLNFTADSFAGNKGFCGASQFKVKKCKIPRSSIKNKLLKYLLAPMMLSVIVAAIIFILILRCGGRKLSASLIDLPRAVTHERISYGAILHATCNLGEENLIGRGSFGSVYKGKFSNGMFAAVKVFNLDVQGASRSFETECRILRSIRHRNLVKVISSCSNFHFKALVMAYMPNGNLENWLYSGTSSLNIHQRLGIMKDVASAVEYLHEGYTFPIVHCDLKPNNILLDEDMVAHVGDFGIAKLLTQEQRMQQTRTLGTIGYIAPEYGSGGLVSTMADVYSYGILLMEVITRRKPTDEMFSGDLTMRRWVSESIPNSVLQIVDDERNIEGHERWLTSVMEVALECTADVAEERPKMKDVLVRMTKILIHDYMRQAE